jgi:hypothetical protein
MGGYFSLRDILGGCMSPEEMEESCELVFEVVANTLRIRQVLDLVCVMPHAQSQRMVRSDPCF